MGKKCPKSAAKCPCPYHKTKRKKKGKTKKKQTGMSPQSIITRIKGATKKSSELKAKGGRMHRDTIYEGDEDEILPHKLKKGKSRKEIEQDDLRTYKKKRLIFDFLILQYRLKNLLE